MESKYPDLHRANSKGAAQAKQQVREVNVIAVDGTTRERLHDAVDYHLEAERQNGDRTCVAMTGELLTLVSVRLRESRRDVGAQSMSANRGTQFVLAREVEIPDCARLLGR